MNSIYLILCLNAVSPNPSETWSVIKKALWSDQNTCFYFLYMKLFINDLEYLGYFLIVLSVLLKMGPCVVRHTLHLVHA